MPLRQLALHGHQTLMPPYTTETVGGRAETQVRLRYPPDKADLWVVQQRNEEEFARIGMKTLRQTGAALVADIDDDYINLAPDNPAFLGGHPNRAHGVIVNRKLRRLNGVKRPIASTSRANLLSVLEQADMVTAATPALAETYQHLNGNIVVLRNMLDWDMWSHVKPQYQVQRKRLLIGYHASYAFHRRNAKVLEGRLGKLLQKHSHVDVVCNSFEMHELLGVPPGRRVVHPEYSFWTPGLPYPLPTKVASCDIGLVPLAPGRFNEGKSHLKGMEYNAAGIPFVATPTESYRYWCDDYNGILIEREYQWAEALDELISNDRLRRDMGQHGREVAAEHTFQRRWKDWQRAYDALIGDRYVRTAREALTHHAVQKPSELAELLRLMAPRKPKVIVEVGSAGGGTLWAFTRIAAEDALIVSIDMPAGSPADTFAGKDVYARPERIELRQHARSNQRVVLLDGDSQADEMRARLERVLRGRRIDLLFIDADHRYQGVKRDFELYSPLVAPGGVIGLHDIVDHKRTDVGVDRFWKEVKKRYESREFRGKETWGFNTWGGIGLLVNPEDGHQGQEAGSGADRRSRAA
jgi:cephalosporin hydroxylase